MEVYRTTSVRALIRHEGKVLVEWLALKNLCFLPGGTVEADEELTSALQRELKEELVGSDLVVGNYLGEIGHCWKTSTGADSCLNRFYEVNARNPEKLRANEVGREVRWLPITPAGIESLQPPSLRILLLKSMESSLWKVIDD